MQSHTHCHKSLIFDQNRPINRLNLNRTAQTHHTQPLVVEGNIFGNTWPPIEV